MNTLSVTKVFRFEMAHAIFQYPGSCCNIHGHSYVLHVTVESKHYETAYLKGTGMFLDFKQLKEIVNQNVIQVFDHKLVLSKDYVAANSVDNSNPAMVIFDAEPTVENMLFFIQQAISPKLESHLKLSKLVLWETSDSYAEMNLK